jgi:hypothetical protein
VAPGVTLLSGGGMPSEAATASLATASVTPAGGSVVLLGIWYDITTAPAAISSVTGLGGTWAKLTTIQQKNLTTTLSALDLWWVAATSSGTISITCSSAANAAAWAVCQVTSVSTTAPFVSANTVINANASLSGSPAITYTQAMTAGNVFLAFIGSVDPETAEGAGFTTLGHQSFDNTTTGVTGTLDPATNASPGSTTAFTWTQTSTFWETIGVELAAAAAAALLPQQEHLRFPVLGGGALASNAGFAR